MTTPQQLLTIQGLDAGYGRRAVLRGISLTIGTGEIVGLFGPNGSGKSTLLKTIGGLLAPERGRVCLNGRDITDVPAHRRRELGVAYFVQGGQVFPSLSGKENLEIALRSASWQGDKRRIEELLSVIEPWQDKEESGEEESGQNEGIAFHGHILRTRAGLLSGGERQALAIAMTLACQPKLLLFDEPTAGLAHQRVTNVLRDIRRIAKEKDVGVLLVEQRQTQAEQFCDRSIRLAQGRLFDAHNEFQPAVSISAPVHDNDSNHNDNEEVTQ